MNSMIYQGEVSHARLTPVQHSFRYPVDNPLELEIFLHVKVSSDLFPMLPWSD